MKATKAVLATATKGYKVKQLYNWEQVITYQNRGWQITMGNVRK